MKNKINGYIKILIIAFSSTFAILFATKYLSKNDSAPEKSNNMLNKNILEKDSTIVLLKKILAVKDSLIKNLNDKNKNCENKLESKEKMLNEIIEEISLSDDNKILLDKNPEIIKIELVVLKNKQKELKKRLQDEITGENGKIGYGPVAKSIEKQLIEVTNKINALNNKLKNE